MFATVPFSFITIVYTVKECLNLVFFKYGDFLNISCARGILLVFMQIWRLLLSVCLLPSRALGTPAAFEGFRPALVVSRAPPKWGLPPAVSRSHFLILVGPWCDNHWEEFGGQGFAGSIVG